MASVLTVDDHPVVLQGCPRILEAAVIRGIFEAGDTTAAYDLFRHHRPDVAVIDLSMRNHDPRGLSLIRQGKAHDPRFPMVVLSMHPDPTVVLQALEAGALGYIS